MSDDIEVALDRVTSLSVGKLEREVMPRRLADAGAAERRSAPS